MSDYKCPKKSPQLSVPGYLLFGSGDRDSAKKAWNNIKVGTDWYTALVYHDNTGGKCLNASGDGTDNEYCGLSTGKTIYETSATITTHYNASTGEGTFTCVPNCCQPDAANSLLPTVLKPDPNHPGELTCAAGVVPSKAVVDGYYCNEDYQTAACSWSETGSGGEPNCIGPTWLGWPGSMGEHCVDCGVDDKCNSKGTCVTLEYGGKSCTCDDGYSGIHCEIPPSKTKCSRVNPGTCEYHIDMYGSWWIKHNNCTSGWEEDGATCNFTPTQMHETPAPNTNCTCRTPLNEEYGWKQVSTVACPNWAAKDLPQFPGVRDASGMELSTKEDPYWNAANNQRYYGDGNALCQSNWGKYSFQVDNCEKNSCWHECWGSDGTIDKGGSYKTTMTNCWAPVGSIQNYPDAYWKGYVPPMK